MPDSFEIPAPVRTTIEPAMTPQITSLLFVCTGNICRSPTAEGVMRKMARDAGLSLRIESRATHGYHIGEPPDPRTIRHAATRGYDLSPQRAKKLAPAISRNST